MSFFISFLLFFSSTSDAKPFKRVLVLSGGGIAPGIPLGIIAGLKEKGWQPDLIIGTCGSGLGAAIFNSEQSIAKSFSIVTSPEVFDALKRAKISTSNLFDIQDLLIKGNNTRLYPPIFKQTLLKSPDDFIVPLQNRYFLNSSHDTRAIIIAAEATFGPNDEGLPRLHKPLFKQVYFTDSDTAQWLQSRQLSIRNSFPVTTIERKTEVIDNADLMTAARAGFADPFLLNPSIINGNYFFTGAVDLYPIELAESLGDEVIATYPVKLFESYQDNAIYATFGYRQSERVIDAIQNKNVKWIDVSGDEELIFDPKRILLTMVSGVPDDYMEFKLKVGEQWSFGRARAIESLKFAPGTKKDVRLHLRRPINPKLKEKFSCENAYEWKTNNSEKCFYDKTSGCNRKTAQWCRPLR